MLMLVPRVLILFIFLWQNMSVGRESSVAPPAPPLKAQTSPLVNMFTQESNTPVSTITNSTDRHSGIMNMPFIFSLHHPLCWRGYSLFFAFQNDEHSAGTSQSLFYVLVDWFQCSFALSGQPRHNLGSNRFWYPLKNSRHTASWWCKS